MNHPYVNMILAEPIECDGCKGKVTEICGDCSIDQPNLCEYCHNEEGRKS